MILWVVLLLGTSLGACEKRTDTDRSEATPGETSGNPTSAIATSESTTSGEPTSEPTMPRSPIEIVQERHTPALMRIEGVVGTYVGQTSAGEPCIKIMVRERTPDLLARLPRELEGHPVEIVEAGTIRPLPGADSS